MIFSGNVYQNAPPQLRGKAKYLRVLHIDPKTYTYWYKRPYISTGPVVSAVQSEGVKRVLGTVPIEADGSVAFHAPPGMALHFQLLDENGRALQTMRSFVGVMPGEQRGCLGCHESHSRAPQYEGRRASRWRRTRAPITPPPWSDTTVSYPRYVQPVLDKYCGKCHQGDGEGMKALDLTSRPGFLGFAEPYHVLIGRPSWGTPYQRPPERRRPGSASPGCSWSKATASRPGGLQDADAHDQPLLQEPARGTLLQRKALRRAGGPAAACSGSSPGWTPCARTSATRRCGRFPTRSSRAWIGSPCARESRPPRGSCAPGRWTIERDGADPRGCVAGG